MRKLVVSLLIIVFFQLKVFASSLPEYAPITRGFSPTVTKITAPIVSFSETTQSFTPFTNKQIIVNFDETMKSEVDLASVNNIKAGEFYQVVIQNIDLIKFVINISSVDTFLSNKQKTPTFADLKTLQANNTSVQKSDESTASNRIYYSLPLQFTKEQTFLSINITPRKKDDTTSDDQSYSTRLAFPFSKKGYNVTGVSYYCSGLYDETYSIQKPTDTTSIYNREPGSTREAGISVMYKAGTKMIGDWFGGHVSIGVGASIANNIRPRILYGLGISIGKKHMFSFDFGGISGMVDRLSSAVDLGKAYSAKQLPSPITKQILETSYFLSLGYLFRF